MLKKDAVQSISLVLVVTMALWGTGITRAAVDATYGSPVQSSSEGPVPWAPMTDSELAEIEGGLGFWALVAVAVVATLACYLIISGVEKLFEPDETSVDDVPHPTKQQQQKQDTTYFIYIETFAPTNCVFGNNNTVDYGKDELGTPSTCPACATCHRSVTQHPSSP